MRNTYENTKRGEPLDGVMLNAPIIRLPYRWAAYAYPGLDDLRRTPGLRSRILQVPYDFAIPIRTQTTHKEQVRSRAGSWVWGIKLVMLGGASASSLAIKIAETGGYPLFSAPVRGSQFVPTNSGTQRTPLFYLPKPWQVPTGQLTVEITNRSTSSIQCQLCIVIQEEYQGVAQRGGVSYINPNPAGTYGGPAYGLPITTGEEY